MSPARGNAIPTTMKAQRVHDYGGPNVIVLEDVETPVPAGEEVLVHVKAAGVGPWDGWIRGGKSVLPQPLPLTLGSDLSGIVESVGPGVTNFRPGDEIFGVTNPRFTDAYAEYAIASAKMIAKKPKALGWVEAASVPVVAVTAWQMVMEHAKVKAGQTVLVHGAAGNVGAFAVQFAHQEGARVIATAKGADIDYVRSLGADDVIDFTTTRFEDAAGRVSAVIDTVGGETMKRSFDVLERGGVMVSAADHPDADEAERRGVRAFFFLVEVTTARLERIAQRLEAGKLQTCVGATLPLAKAPEAHQMMEGTRPRPRGKLVLEVSS